MTVSLTESGLLYIKNMIHKSLFINKAIDLLITNKDGIYIDCTFGFGGHSKKVLNRLTTKGKLIAIDNDLITKNLAKQLGILLDNRFSFINTNFSFLESIAIKKKLLEKYQVYF